MYAFFFQAEDGIRDYKVTGVQTCALPICPAHIEGNRAYLSYGDGGGIILDVSDMSQPKMISQIAFRGITATQGIHTYLPLPSRKIALVNDEAIRENGDENLNMA